MVTLQQLTEKEYAPVGTVHAEILDDERRAPVDNFLGQV